MHLVIYVSDIDGNLGQLREYMEQNEAQGCPRVYILVDSR